MKVLIIGSGGREYAIGKKIYMQHPDAEIFFAPGNGGTTNWGSNISFESSDDLLRFAINQKIDLTIVGPEKPLVEGIVDLFQQKGLAIFGPNQKAAQLEGSKRFAKDFMSKYGVKTAAYKSFQHFVDAKDYIESVSYPIVIKASGLAQGKGVVICHDAFEAEDVLEKMMQNNAFGTAGHEVVIEEFLDGFEASIISIYNGKSIYCMQAAQDYKKSGENDTGTNTGGMGVVVPNPEFTSAHYQEFENNILTPTLEGLQKENLQFSGVIFFGLMVTATGVYLLEYNVRFGDPETQTLLPLLESDLLSHLQNAIENKPIEYKWSSDNSICVVMVSGGYPNEYDTGFEIIGLENLDPEDYDVAGAIQKDNTLYTSGGRVLDILASGADLSESRQKVYENLDKVRFEYNYFRKDIGKKTILNN